MTSLSTMTAQELFDRTVGAVIKQGAPSIRNGACVYRGPGGLKCAIGHIITDAQYDPIFDSDTNFPGAEAILMRIGLPAHLHELAHKIQYAHDNTSMEDGNFVENFSLAARDIAEREGLDCAVAA